MGIIKTIISLFKTDKSQSKLEPPTLDDYDDIDAENTEREKWTMRFYSETQAQNKKIDSHLQDYQDKRNPELIAINSEYERQASYRIKYHFIPHEQNNRNVRSYISYTFGHWQKWQDIRLHYFKKYNHTCQSCLKEFEAKKLQLHEYWTFDDRGKIQKLDSLIPLCKECHEIAHINRHSKNEKKVLALTEKYALYNGVPDDMAFTDMDFATKERNRRNDIKYSLDLSLLYEFLELKEPFDCHEEGFDYWLNATFIDNE